MHDRQGSVRNQERVYLQQLRLRGEVDEDLGTVKENKITKNIRFDG